VLEERVRARQDAQQVWSPRYVDAMVLRDRDTDGNGTLEQRLYVQQDANFNVTALTNASGVVQERYAYDPYGTAEVLNPDWTADTDGSDYGWVYLHQGGRYDAASGLYSFRHREYSAELGRWVQQDPQGYIDGASLYAALQNNPVKYVDPLGFAAAEPAPDPQRGEPFRQGQEEAREEGTRRYQERCRREARGRGMGQSKIASRGKSQQGLQQALQRQAEELSKITKPRTGGGVRRPPPRAGFITGRINGCFIAAEAGAAAGTAVVNSPGGAAAAGYPIGAAPTVADHLGLAIFSLFGGYSAQNNPYLGTDGLSVQSRDVFAGSR
jgi:RHS repeat-associated protein